MLAFLFSLVVATTLPSCDAVDSCLGQVNGTLPLRTFIPTLAKGGEGYTFTTSNCVDGTLALSDSCMCGTEQMNNHPGYPGYCHQASLGTFSLYKHDYAFCANQFGLVKNEFFPMNSTYYLQCHCFDSTTGISTMARLGKPYCSSGFSYYEDCNVLDGTDANKALLAPYTGEKAAAIELLFPNDLQPERAPACQCGEYAECRAPTQSNPHQKPYCQYLVEECTSVKECGVDAWQPTGIFDDDGCACGDETCEHNEVCESETKDGKTIYVCTWNGGRSSEIRSIIKASAETSGTAFVFSLLVFICALFACIIVIVTYCKARKI